MHSTLKTRGGSLSCLVQYFFYRMTVAYHFPVVPFINTTACENTVRKANIRHLEKIQAWKEYTKGYSVLNSILELPLSRTCCLSSLSSLNFLHKLVLYNTVVKTSYVPTVYSFISSYLDQIPAIALWKTCTHC